MYSDDCQDQWPLVLLYRERSEGKERQRKQRGEKTDPSRVQKTASVSINGMFKSYSAANIQVV